MTSKLLRLGLNCMLWTLLSLGLAGSTLAQQSKGSLYGFVTDTEGGRLPGVSLTLTGFGESKTQTTNRLGGFRFLGLEPGFWSLEAKLDGFATVNRPNIAINLSRSVDLSITMSSQIEEVITVTAESPLLDERKVSAGTTVSLVELVKIPAPRNGFAYLPQSPAVLVSQVAVGDAFSDTGSHVRGQAADASENDYIIDGVQVTSLLSPGNAAAYPFVDQLEEMQIVTGGNDVSKNTAGVAINAVTKRGSNEFRGSARYMLSDSDGYFGVLKQAEPGWNPDDLGPGQQDFVGDSIDRIQDYGFEAGGPAWRDRVWLWGTWGFLDSQKIAGDGTPKRVTLEPVAVKVNAQPSAANSFMATYNTGVRLDAAFNAGQNVDASALLEQDGQTGTAIFEDSQVFGSSFFLSGRYSHRYTSAKFLAKGGAGPDQPPVPDPGGEVNVDANGLRTNNFSFFSRRPADDLELDASYSGTTGSLSHEIRFGGRLRRIDATEIGTYPGRGLLHYDGGFAGVQDPALLAALGLPPERYMDAHLVYAYRAGTSPTTNDYRSLWAQDTLTWSRWTVNVGLRYDHQFGENRPETVEANLGFPEVMPPIEFEGNNGGLDWKSLSPRLGVTYALGEERKTLLRGSLARFPDALNKPLLLRDNPVSYQYAAILFLDEPGGYPAFYDDGELFSVFAGVNGFDPENPTAISTANVNDPNMDPPTTSELIVGVEHALLPQFVVGGSLTWRRRSSVADEQPLFRDASGQIRTASASEYVFDGTIRGTLPDGSAYAIDTFAANPTLKPTFGDLYTNGVREIDSFATSITVTKRLSNQWMLRGFVNYFFSEDWQVPSAYFDNNDPNKFVQGSNRDGAPFVELTDRNTSALSSTWQWNVNGMYQIAPERAWGFNVAANLTGRQGFPIPYYRPVVGSDGVRRPIGVADSITDFRYDDVFVADVRVEKEFAATADTSLTFSIDGFNIFNDGTVVSRINNLNPPTNQWVLRTVLPRVWRLGVRLNWR